MLLRVVRPDNHPAEEHPMADHVYKSIELTGTSQQGIEAAINCALSRAAKTVRNMRWFEVAGIRGQIDDGSVSSYQVTLKIGFTLEG
jgi:flavin-binding protein dodecin